MTPEIDESRHNKNGKTEPHMNEQILTGAQAQWRSELARILPAASPSESPLTYRREVSKTVHDYLQQDANFAVLNDRLHKEHALKQNYKVVGLTVFEGLPELVVVDKSVPHGASKARALSVSAETGLVNGSFSKDSRNHLRHSAFEDRPENLLPIPLAAGGTIWRDRNGEGQIKEVDTPRGLKELINYDPRGHVQKLDFMIGTNPLGSYLRNEDGSYDAIGPHQKVVRGLVNDISVVDDRSYDTGELIFSMHGGKMTKWMRPNGQVRAVY
jgi:hypothetical protein